MNKLRHSTYTHTPSGTKSKDVALLLLSLSILHYFSKAPKEGGAKQFRFAPPPVFLFCIYNTLNNEFRTSFGFKIYFPYIFADNTYHQKLNPPESPYGRSEARPAAHRSSGKLLDNAIQSDFADAKISRL